MARWVGHIIFSLRALQRYPVSESKLSFYCSQHQWQSILLQTILHSGRTSGSRTTSKMVESIEGRGWLLPHNSPSFRFGPGHSASLDNLVVPVIKPPTELLLKRVKIALHSAADSIAAHTRSTATLNPARRFPPVDPAVSTRLT